MELEKMLIEIESRKDFVVPLIKKLLDSDKIDGYWQELYELSQKEYFFEPCLMQNWLGDKFQPKKILEIGTRTGGSLIFLLSAYKNIDDVKIVSFDMWREINSALFIKKIPLLRHLPLPACVAINKVKKNLSLFNISSKNIKFVSGDSKIKVPEYFKQNPNDKFDYILVDGGHDKYTALTDLENVVNYVEKGGFIVFDDIGPESYKLIDVWDQFKNNHKNDFDFYEKFHRKGVAWAIKK